MEYIPLFISIFGLYVAWHAQKALQSGAPFLPTRKKHFSIFDEIKCRKGMKFVDLGSGEGRLVFEAARRGAEARGVEIQPVLYWVAQIKKVFSKQKNKITFLQEDLWEHNIEDADIVFLFFIQSKMNDLKKKLEKELKPGTLIVSHIFTIPGWQYTKKHGSMYIYTKP